MSEVELITMFGKEGIALLTVVLIYFLFIKPKDKQVAEKDVQITELVETNRVIVKENSEQLGNIAGTLDKVSGELITLNKNQQELKIGQDELWDELVQLKQIKGEDKHGL